MDQWARRYVESGALYQGPRPLVRRHTRGQKHPSHFRVPKQASGAAHGAGDGRSRVDIGRCEAQGGVPRPPPQPTGPRGPLGPCPARLVPHRRPQHPRLDPRQRPRLAALMEAGGVRERPWCISSGCRPTQSPGSCSWDVWGAWGSSRADVWQCFRSCQLNPPTGCARGPN